jgi:hypothetical protein
VQPNESVLLGNCFREVVVAAKTMLDEQLDVGLGRDVVLASGIV